MRMEFWRGTAPITTTKPALLDSQVIDRFSCGSLNAHGGDAVYKSLNVPPIAEDNAGRHRSTRTGYEYAKSASPSRGYAIDIPLERVAVLSSPRLKYQIVKNCVR